MLTQRIHHASIFPFVELASRGWEDQDASAGVTEDQQLHVSPEGRTKPTVILTIHYITLHFQPALEGAG